MADEIEKLLIDVPHKREGLLFSVEKNRLRLFLNMEPGRLHIGMALIGSPRTTCYELFTSEPTLIVPMFRTFIENPLHAHLLRRNHTDALFSLALLRKKQTFIENAKMLWKAYAEIQNRIVTPDTYGAYFDLTSDGETFSGAPDYVLTRMAWQARLHGRNDEYQSLARSMRSALTFM